MCRVCAASSSFSTTQTTARACDRSRCRAAVISTLTTPQGSVCKSGNGLARWLAYPLIVLVDPRGAVVAGASGDAARRYRDPSRAVSCINARLHLKVTPLRKSCAISKRAGTRSEMQPIADREIPSSIITNLELVLLTNPIASTQPSGPNSNDMTTRLLSLLNLKIAVVFRSVI